MEKSIKKRSIEFRASIMGMLDGAETTKLERCIIERYCDAKAIYEACIAEMDEGLTQFCDRKGSHQAIPEVAIWKSSITEIDKLNEKVQMILDRVPAEKPKDVPQGSAHGDRWSSV